MGYIIFAGTDSRTMNMFVEEMPDRPRAKKRVTEDQVIGRSGKLHTDTGAWEMISLTVKLNMWDKANDKNVANWLSGYGTLVLSDDLTKCWRAHVIDEVTAARRRTPSGANYDTVTVKFQCEPFLYESAPAQITVTGETSVQCQGTVNADPWIFVTATGDASVTVGENTVELSGMTGSAVLIDCDAKMCVLVDDPDTQVAVTLTTGEWPEFGVSGDTVAVDIEGEDIDEVRIQPNWRWV